MTRSPPKPKRRRYLKSSRQVKTNWLYTQQEIMEIYDVSRNTILNWIRYGLPVIQAQKRLFHGEAVNEFHRKRRENAKIPCDDNEIYCVSCKNKHSLVIEPFEVAYRGNPRVWIMVRCPETGVLVHRFAAAHDITRIRALLKSKSSPENHD